MTLYRLELSRGKHVVIHYRMFRVDIEPHLLSYQHTRYLRMNVGHLPIGRKDVRL